MTDAALDGLFAALNKSGSGKLSPEEMCKLGKAVLGTMPTPEAAKKEIERAAGEGSKECDKAQFKTFALAGLGKCSDAGDAAAVVAIWTERVKACK